jgi:hypothetical protein
MAKSADSEVPASFVAIKQYPSCTLIRRNHQLHDLLVPCNVAADDAEHCDYDHQRPQAELEAAAEIGLVGHAAILAAARQAGPK